MLTIAGARLSREQILQIHAICNYLRIGAWMRDRGYIFERRVSTREEVWTAILKEVRDRRVLYLEFGVAYGNSMRYWSRELKHTESVLHGFDSFEGMPEEAGRWSKGQYGANGRMPEIDDPRVQFFKGWFNEVLPQYVPPIRDVLLVNMDADIYSSTRYVLNWLQPYMRPGTFIYFDEMNHVEHEPRAFDEFVESNGLRFKPICADKTLAFVSFKCVE
jgi:O-methyltransferase